MSSLVFNVLRILSLYCFSLDLNHEISDLFQIIICTMATKMNDSMTINFAVES